jgi:hypothetical protein
MNKIAKKYYKDVYFMFPNHSVEEKNFLHQLKTLIERHQQDYPETTYTQYTEKFGQPEDIVAAFYQRLDNKLIITKIQATRWIKYAVIVFIVISILFGIGSAYRHYKRYQYEQAIQESEDYYVEETITEIE